MKSQVLILNCESLFSYMILRKNLISFYYISVSPRSMWKLWFNKILGFISLQIGFDFGTIRSWKGPFLAGIFRSHQHCGFIWWDFAKIKNNFEGWTEFFPHNIEISLNSIPKSRSCLLSAFIWFKWKLLSFHLIANVLSKTRK